jgi:hypothetical protein
MQVLYVLRPSHVVRSVEAGRSARRLGRHPVREEEHQVGAIEENLSENCLKYT